MARYDIESDVQFAEKRFAEARAYREKVAKEQDDFAKKLLGLKGVVEGVNLMVNNAADEMERKQLPKKASYDVLNSRSESIRNEEAARISSGLSVQDFLENKYFTQLSQEASQTFSQLSPAQYTKALRDEAAKLATNNVSSYESLVKAANNIPDFENFDEFYKQNSNMPRSIAGWIGNKAKSFLKKETPETLKIKNEKASDALYGTAMFDKFGKLSTALTAYDAVTNKGLDAVKIINNLDLKSGGLSKDFSKTVTKKEVDKISGTVKEITYFKGATFKTDGSGMVEFKPENTFILDTIITRTDDNRVLQSDVNKLYELANKDAHAALSDILKNADGRPTFQQYQEARNYLSVNPSKYAIDWQDEKSKGDAFPKWFSTQIIGVKDSDGTFIAGDSDGDGIYTILPAQRERANNLGFDEPTMRAKFNKLGSEVNISTQTVTDIKEIDILDAVDLKESIPDDLIQNYTDLFTGENAPILDIMSNQITKAENKNQNIIDLGNLNLELMFPNLGLTGEAHLYYNRKTNQFLRK